MSTATATAPWGFTEPAGRSARPHLRLVEGGAPAPREATGRRGGEIRADLPPVPAGRRRLAPEVRRRRLLLVAAVVLSVGLALPLSGTGGRSHAAGSAPAGAVLSGTYTVRAGDSLWSIAERADPTGDPRPLVARLAAQVGSDTVVPGEQLVLP